MHAIILFLIGMISTQIAYSQEKSFEFNSALLTHHFSKLNADKYENKVSKDGRTINNKLYSLTLSESEEGVYSSTNFFIGKDSINTDMFGFMLSKGFGSVNTSGIHLGGIWGLYFYDESKWEKHFHDREEKTPSWLRANYGDFFKGVNMIFGLEVNAQLYISKSVYIKQKNVITPMITIHSIGIGISY